MSFLCIIRRAHIDNQTIEEIKKSINDAIIEAYISMLSYKVQLIANKREGRKIIFVNSFCMLLYADAENFWKNDIFAINDGGNCNFQGEYDVEKHIFRGF